MPRGPKVVPFGGSYIESYKVTPKRNYFGASGWSLWVYGSVLFSFSKPSPKAKHCSKRESKAPNPSEHRSLHQILGFTWFRVYFGGLNSEVGILITVLV